MLPETEADQVRLRLAVAVATLGRRQECEDLLAELKSQSRKADTIIFSVVDMTDAPSVDLDTSVQIVVSPRKGLCAQRNAALDALAGDHDVVLFLDDDFIPATNYLEVLERVFLKNTDIGGITGRVLADGIGGPGLSRSDARSIINSYQAQEPRVRAKLRSRRGLYGCNMAINLKQLNGLRFEEKLPLYGWLEDLDMSTRLRAFTRLAADDELIGVHLGVKRGRVSGVRLGYSQIANPVFLLLRRRGPVHFLIANIMRNLLANTAKSIRPEPWVDRRGRLKGNLLGLFDLINGRLDPMRVIDLK